MDSNKFNDTGKSLENTGNQMQKAEKSTTKIGCSLIILIAIIIALVVIIHPGNKDNSNSKSANNSVSISENSNVPDEVALITYAESILAKEYGDANFCWTEYYNTVAPSYGLRAKVEGTAKINGIKKNFIMIYDFTDETYQIYNAKYLELDGTVIYDLR